MAEVNDRLVIELEAKIDKLAAGVAAGNRSIQNFARQAEKDLTDMQLKLQIAQARGDKAAAQSLADQIQLQSVKSKLMRQGVAEAEAMAQAELHLAAVEKARRAAEGPNIGRAARSVFDSTRFNIAEEGATKLRFLGSAVEPLGALGIGAAVGVIALNEAFAKVKEASEYANSLYKAAAAAHTTTDQLQEMRAALVKAGGDEGRAGEALQGFNENLGKAEAGIPRALRAFRELFGTSFGASDAKRLAASGDALDQVVARIQQLKNPEQQDAAIQQFGLEGLKPLILAGAEAWKSYREEAKAAGLVLDAEVIRRGHELATQIDELSLKVKNDLTTAFIDLEPILVRLLGYVADMLDKVKGFTGELTKTPAGAKLLGDLVNPQRGVGGTFQIEKDIIDLIRQKQLVGKVDFASGPITEAQLQQGLGPQRTAGSGELHDLTPDKSLDIRKASGDREFEAQKAALQRAADELKAREALTEAIQERATIEAELADNAQKQRDLELDKQVFDATIERAKKQITHAALDQVKSETNAARASAETVDGLTKALRERQAEWALVDHEVSLRKQDVAALEATYQTNALIATTAKDRHEAERHLLAIRQTELAQELNLDISRGLETGRYGADDAKRLRRDQADTFAAQRTQLDYNQAGPLDQYLRGIQDLNTEFQQDGVEAIQALDTGLVNAALHARNLGQVAEEVFLNLIAKIAEQTLAEQAGPGLVSAAKAVLAFLPGFASGTSNTPDGPILVGENGPEILNPGRGNAIISNSAIRAASGSSARASGAVVYAPAQFDLRGAVVTQDLLDQMNRISAGHARQAGIAAVTASKRGLAGAQRSASLLEA